MPRNIQACSSCLRTSGIRPATSPFTLIPFRSSPTQDAGEPDLLAEQGWNATEVDRSAFDRAPETAPVTAFLRMELEELPPVKLLTGSSEELLEPTIYSLGDDGNVYVLDRATRGIHVFDRTGKWLHVCPGPEGLDYANILGSIVVRSDGHVFFPHDRDERALFYFDGTGRYVGLEQLGGHKILFKPESDRRWSLGYDEVRWINAEGRVVRTIERRPDNNWLRNSIDFSVSRDGTLAVLDCDRTREADHEGSFVAFYDQGGFPMHMVQVSQPDEGTPRPIVYAGKWVLLGAPLGQARFLRVKDDTLHYCENPHERTERGFRPYSLTRDGGELWYFERESRTFYRYALP